MAYGTLIKKDPHPLDELLLKYMFVGLSYERGKEWGLIK